MFACVCVCGPHHYAGVELVEALDSPVTEAVTQVLLDEVGMVQDVVGHQGSLMVRGGIRETPEKGNERKRERERERERE